MEFEAEWALEHVDIAAARLSDRLDRLEVTDGEIGLLFLTRREAEALRSAVAVHEGADPAMRSVLLEELRGFIDGIGMTIKRQE